MGGALDSGRGSLFLLLGAWRFTSARLNAAPEVRTERVAAISAASAPQGVVLNATGYIVAAHKIEVAAKVVGKVKWIGVDKGDHVQEGQVLVRLEDDEYHAQLQQANGQLDMLQARLAEALHGSRPEEIAKAMANVDVGQGRPGKRQGDARPHARDWSREGVAPAAVARRCAGPLRFRRAQSELAPEDLRTGETRAAAGGDRRPARAGGAGQRRGGLCARPALNNTVIRAPVTGTILERAVEKGEFVTTSFVGDRGAKGYVVSLADLNDLEVELDISQNDFAKLHAGQHGIITTDAFPDRKYDGFIKEISPEANRQKATVQIKVKVVKPDDYLRPEMNASVAFSPMKSRKRPLRAAKPVIMVPASAVRDGAVFVCSMAKLCAAR